MDTDIWCSHLQFGFFGWFGLQQKNYENNTFNLSLQSFFKDNFVQYEYMMIFVSVMNSQRAHKMCKVKTAPK